MIHLIFMDLLYLARLNEDSEIVHYATTFISEISSQYDEKLSAFEKLFERVKQTLTS